MSPALTVAPALAVAPLIKASFFIVVIVAGASGLAAGAQAAQVASALLVTTLAILVAVTGKLAFILTVKVLLTLLLPGTFTD